MGTAGTLAELVADVATTDPDKLAIIFGDQAISYAQLNAGIERAADGLAACGVRPGDRVALRAAGRFHRAGEWSTRATKCCAQAGSR